MVSGEYKPFDVLTRSALYHAAAERGLDPPPTETMDALMRSYDALRVFPEVPGALELLRRSLFVEVVLVRFLQLGLPSAPCMLPVYPLQHV